MEIFGSYGIDGLGQPWKNSIYYDANTHIFRASDNSPYRGTKTDVYITEQGNVGIGTTDAEMGLEINRENYKVLLGYNKGPTDKNIGLAFDHPLTTQTADGALWVAGAVANRPLIMGTFNRGGDTTENPILFWVDSLDPGSSDPYNSTITLRRGGIVTHKPIDNPAAATSASNSELTGSMYYNKTGKVFKYNDGNGWKDLGGGGGSTCDTTCSYYIKHGTHSHSPCAKISDTQCALLGHASNNTVSIVGYENCGARRVCKAWSYEDTYVCSTTGWVFAESLIATGLGIGTTN